MGFESDSSPNLVGLELESHAVGLGLGLDSDFRTRTRFGKVRSWRFDLSLPNQKPESETAIGLPLTRPGYVTYRYVTSWQNIQTCHHCGRWIYQSWEISASHKTRIQTRAMHKHLDYTRVLPSKIRTRLETCKTRTRLGVEKTWTRCHYAANS